MTSRHFHQDSLQLRGTLMWPDVHDPHGFVDHTPVRRHDLHHRSTGVSEALVTNAEDNTNNYMPPRRTGVCHRPSEHTQPYALDEGESTVPTPGEFGSSIASQTRQMYPHKHSSSVAQPPFGLDSEVRLEEENLHAQPTSARRPNPSQADEVCRYHRFPGQRALGRLGGRHMMESNSDSFWGQEGVAPGIVLGTHDDHR